MATKEKDVVTTKNKCRYCGNDLTQGHKDLPNNGKSGGSSTALGNAMAYRSAGGNANDENGKPRTTHPWELAGKKLINYDLKGKSYTKRKKTLWSGSTIQPHHLIAISVVLGNKTDTKDKKYKNPKGIPYKTICKEFGFNIDSSENGVWLPSKSYIACQVRKPLHKSRHPSIYFKNVRKILKPLMEAVARGDYCSKPDEFVQKMNKRSSLIFKGIMTFNKRWVLTSDALDYMENGIGCGDSPWVSGKKNCSHNGKHKFPLGTGHTPEIGQ